MVISPKLKGNFTMNTVFTASTILPLFVGLRCRELNWQHHVAWTPQTEPPQHALTPQMLCTCREPWPMSIQGSFPSWQIHGLWSLPLVYYDPKSWTSVWVGEHRDETGLDEKALMRVYCGCCLQLHNLASIVKVWFFWMDPGCCRNIQPMTNCVKHINQNQTASLDHLRCIAFKEKPQFFSGREGYVGICVADLSFDLKDEPLTWGLHQLSMSVLRPVQTSSVCRRWACWTEAATMCQY